MLTLPKKQLPTTPVDKDTVVPIVSRNIVPVLQALLASLGSFGGELQSGTLDLADGHLTFGHGPPPAGLPDNTIYFDLDAP